MATNSTQTKYVPDTRESNPKSASQGEFVEQITRNPYKGFYVQDFKGNYYAGKSIKENGVQLERVRTQTPVSVSTLLEQTLLAGLKGFFKKILTQGELDRGVARRFFVQDKNTNKIVETDSATYLQAQSQFPNKNYAQIDWVIQGPAKDTSFNGIPYQGAESKNKKTIQALEKQMPGISLYVTNYAEFVQEITPTVPLNAYTEVQKDAQVTLDNSRKANFDTKK